VSVCSFMVMMASGHSRSRERVFIHGDDGQWPQPLT
jgi:hypothetical protein